MERQWPQNQPRGYKKSATMAVKVGKNVALLPLVPSLVKYTTPLSLWGGSAEHPWKHSRMENQDGSRTTLSNLITALLPEQGYNLFRLHWNLLSDLFNILLSDKS